MYSIVKNCPKLESLHLSCILFIPDIFLDYLGDYLPKAVNLRDFRLEWAEDVKVLDSKVLSFLEDLCKCSSHLERLVISGETFVHKGSRAKNPPKPMSANFLVNFIIEMEQLQALCSATFQLDSIVIEEIKRRVVEEIIPARPSFWLHLDNVLPKANDPAVPRIHYNEIVNPLNYLNAPPKF